jgi:hypothetical protein
MFEIAGGIIIAVVALVVGVILLLALARIWNNLTEPMTFRFSKNSKLHVMRFSRGQFWLLAPLLFVWLLACISYWLPSGH